MPSLSIVLVLGVHAVTIAMTIIYSPSETWSSPPVTGTRPPPCSSFSFVLMDSNKVLLFGGYQPGLAYVNDVYILDLARMVSWNNYCLIVFIWGWGLTLNVTMYIHTSYISEHNNTCLGGGGGGGGN